MQGHVQNTLVYGVSLHKGSQWAILNRRDVYDPLQTHGYRIIIYKGVKHNPRGDKQTTYSFRMK